MSLILTGILTSTSLTCWGVDMPTDPVWKYAVEAGAISRSDASVDSGGDISHDSFALRLSARRSWTDHLSAGFSFGYTQDSYDFHDVAAFANTQPWSEIHSLRLSLPISYDTGDAWNFFVIPSVRFSADKQAELSEGQETGVIAAAGYRFNDRLTLGPGIGFFTEIEGDNNLFPILIINWQMTDTLSVETGRGLAASQGPGITLRWRPDAAWTFSLGARYEKQRFRLSDDGIAPEGVGVEKSVPVAFGIKYAFSRSAEFSVLAGSEYAGRLKLEDRNGNEITAADLDNSTFIGGVFSYRF